MDKCYQKGITECNHHYFFKKSFVHIFYCLYFLISLPETGTEELNGTNLDQSLKSKHPFEIPNTHSFFFFSLPKTYKCLKKKLLRRGLYHHVVNPKTSLESLILNSFTWRERTLLWAGCQQKLSAFPSDPYYNHR